MRTLTLLGRIQIIRTFIVSQFLYVCSIIDTPQKAIKAINTLIYNFVWKGKKDRIRRNVLIKDIREGGLNAPDFETMLKTAQLQWIKKLDINASYPWKLILQHYLEKLNIDIYPLLRSDYDMKTLGMNADSLPKFYYNILKLWSEVGETSPITKRNNLWFNKKICIEKKSLFYKDFDQLGMQYVNDLYKVDGSLIPFREWMARGIKGHRLIKWMGLTGKANSLHGRGRYIKEHNENIQLILRTFVNSYLTSILI